MKIQCSDCKKIFFNKKSFSNHIRFGCNSKANANRDYWYAYFNYKMEVYH
jgi:hypothetical protein